MLDHYRTSPHWTLETGLNRAGRLSMGLPPGVPCTPYFSGMPLQPVFLCCQEEMDEGLRGTREAWGSRGLFLGPPNLLPRGGLLTRHIPLSRPGRQATSLEQEFGVWGGRWWGHSPHPAFLSFLKAEGLPVGCQQPENPGGFVQRGSGQVPHCICVCRSPQTSRGVRHWCSCG